MGGLRSEELCRVEKGYGFAWRLVRKGRGQLSGGAKQVILSIRGRWRIAEIYLSAGEMCMQ